MDYCCEVYQTDETNFNGLNHGDLWVNNNMFKYENENPVDVLLVDFQISWWNSPVLDLIYFFHTSLQDDLREIAHDELIPFYHVNLVESLAKLNYTGKVPTLHELQIEYLKKQFYGRN